MSGDILKKKVLKLCADFKQKFDNYLKKFKIKTAKTIRRTKLYYNNLKKNLLKKENRKKYLTITGILIIINLLIINLFVSFAYYYESDSLSIIRSVVGNMYINEYDYVLLVYLEDTDNNGDGNGKYHLTDNIPVLGYNYSGYKCVNNSTLIYDEETKETSVTLDQKDVCSVYFDVVGAMDLNVKVMLEDGIDSNNYVISDRIPSYGYKYSHYECTNNGKLEYNSELHKVKLSTSSKEYCNIYFTKESSDILIKLYVEETYQNGDYVERLNIPSNHLYILNESKSSCTNNNERIDVAISYIDGYINIETGEISHCDIYLDKYEE